MKVSSEQSCADGRTRSLPPVSLLTITTIPGIPLATSKVSSAPFSDHPLIPALFEEPNWFHNTSNRPLSSFGGVDPALTPRLCNPERDPDADRVGRCVDRCRGDRVLNFGEVKRGERGGDLNEGERDLVANGGMLLSISSWNGDSSATRFLCCSGGESG